MEKASHEFLFFSQLKFLLCHFILVYVVWSRAATTSTRSRTAFAVINSSRFLFSVISGVICLILLFYFVDRILLFIRIRRVIRINWVSRLTSIALISFILFFRRRCQNFYLKASCCLILLQVASRVAIIDDRSFKHDLIRADLRQPSRSRDPQHHQVFPEFHKQRQVLSEGTRQ